MKLFEEILHWFLNDSNLVVISSQRLYLKLAEKLDLDKEIPLETSETIGLVIDWQD